MNILLVFHMAEVFDRGLAGKILDSISSLGEVDCRIAGVTGFTAALDSGLGSTVKLEDRLVSEIISSSTCDVAILASYSSNPAKFHAYCWLISRRVKGKPIVEVEANSRVVIPVTAGAEDVASRVAELLGYEVTPRVSFEENIWRVGGKTYRRVLAAEPGDFILVNGIIVGKATSSDVVLVEENGRITGGVGVNLKLHGLEKLERLGFKGLASSKVSSLKLLRGVPPSRAKLSCKGTGVAMLDHEVRRIHELASRVEGVIAVGDDTTLIVADVFERYGKPIMGIMDGDADGLMALSKLPSNSILLVVERDDEAGQLVKQRVLGGKDYVEDSFKVVAERVVELLKPTTKITIRLR